MEKFQDKEFYLVFLFDSMNSGKLHYVYLNDRASDNDSVPKPHIKPMLHVSDNMKRAVERKVHCLCSDQINLPSRISWMQNTIMLL